MSLSCCIPCAAATTAASGSSSHINTHHLAEAWDQAFPERSWNGCPVHFSHEPVLLDSGGGVKKIEPLASAEEPLLVINGDMAATFDLAG